MRHAKPLALQQGMAELEREDDTVEPDSDGKSDVHIVHGFRHAVHGFIFERPNVADNGDDEPITDGDQRGDRSGPHDDPLLYRLASDADNPDLKTQRDHDACNEHE